jgi:uncharacterized protein YkwD
MLAETNRVRKTNGCHPLKSQRDLNAAAEDQASYMALRLTATHNNAFYGQMDVVARARRHGFVSRSVAENVASIPLRQGESRSASAAIAKELVDAWLRSPGHRANLLNQTFTHLGCAARIAPGMGGREYVFAVQVFSTPAIIAETGM